MTKYILCGETALRYYHQDDYKSLVKAITDKEGDMFAIDSIDEIYELLEQLRGWNDFEVITTLEHEKISDLLEFKNSPVFWFSEKVHELYEQMKSGKISAIKFEKEMIDLHNDAIEMEKCFSLVE